MRGWYNPDVMAKHSRNALASARRKTPRSLKEIMAESHRLMQQSQKLMERMRDLASEIQEQKALGSDRRGK
jgi:hypothetical protein